MIGMVLTAVAGLFGLVAFVCQIILIINAFKTDTTQGILSLCIPAYVVYWGFAKFTHPKKMMIVGGMLAGWLLCGVLTGVGSVMAASAAMDAVQQQFPPGALQQQFPPGVQMPAGYPAPMPQ